MRKYKKTSKERYIPERLTEAERIVKEIGGHIPERVVDEHIPKDEKLVLIPKDIITITKEKYEELVRDAGYYQGRADELEKQLEELRRQTTGETTIERYRRMKKEQEIYNKIKEDK